MSVIRRDTVQPGEAIYAVLSRIISNVFLLVFSVIVMAKTDAVMTALTLAAVEEQLADKSAEFNTLAQRMNNLEKGSHDYEDLEWKLANDPKYQLPEPQGFTTVKSYKAKIVEPLIKRLKSLISNLLVRYFKVQDNYIRVKQENGKLYRENQNLIDSTDRLREENYALREQNKDYTLLRKVFGSQQIDDLIERAKEAQQAQKRQRQKNRGWER